MRNKKSSRIFGSLLIAILLVIAGIGFWQKENIYAFWQSRNYTSEELEKKIELSKEELEKKLEEKYPNLQVKDISIEDEKKIMNNQLSLEEVQDKYEIPAVDIDNQEKKQVKNNINQTKVGKNQVDVSQSLKAEKTSKNQQEIEKKQKEDDIIAEHIGKMYGLKAQYLAEIGRLQGVAKEEYIKGDGKISKKEIAYKYAAKVGKLEKVCDQDVENVLSSLQTKLKELEADTDIIDILRSAYYEEKNAKKAYYMSKM